MNSLVSIIVPVYNSEKYLQNCYESIKKQTYQNIEIIFIDDGSVDNSYQMCKNFQSTDNRVIVKHQKNAGVSKARNNGILSANGDVILFIDADDIVDKNYVELLSEPILKEKYDISERKAADKIKKMDRERQHYYESHTGLEWGSIDSHHMLLNVSRLGMERAVDILEKIYR